MSRRARAARLAAKALELGRREGWGAALRKTSAWLGWKVPLLLRGSDDAREYRRWIARNEGRTAAERRRLLSGLSRRPLFSVVVPVHDAEPAHLRACIRSVLAQSYPEWELRLHDDASTRRDTAEELRSWEGRDPRIRITWGGTNLHISGATNEALSGAAGEFAAFLDHDDLLAPDALLEAALRLDRDPAPDLLYSDEDKVDGKGRRFDPFFKPDWSPDLFLSMNYLCHLVVCRRSVVEAVGGLRAGFEGAQDWDLLLRVSRVVPPERIAHVPRILYHWRATELSTASGVDRKDYAVSASLRALREHLAACGIEGEAEEGPVPGRFRVRRKVTGGETVSIVVPFRDEAEVLSRCVASILGRTSHRSYEILLVDNQSARPETAAYLESLAGEERVRLLRYDHPFNYSAINNFAVGHARGGLVLLLNSDTEAIDPDWLSAMVEHGVRPEVGAVGAKLLYPNRTVQHAGVILGLGVAGHAFKYLPEDSDRYFSQLQVVRNYSAVTAACLLTRRELYLSAGGLNEKELPIAYNDVDYCLRLRRAGYLVVYTPHARLVHHESHTRGNDEELARTAPGKYRRVLAERAYMHAAWGEEIAADPYFNPNLSRRSEWFRLDLEGRPPAPGGEGAPGAAGGRSA